MNRLADKIAEAVKESLLPYLTEKPLVPKAPAKGRGLPTKLQSKWMFLTDALKELSISRRTIDRKILEGAIVRGPNYNGRATVSKSSVSKYLNEFL
ncbi:hypothetical protein [Lacunimicrobium album]